MLNKLFFWFKKTSISRTEIELEKFGYTKEDIEQITNKNLKYWV